MRFSAKRCTMQRESAMGAPVRAMGMLLLLLASTALAGDPPAPEAPSSGTSTAPEAPSSGASAAHARPTNRDKHLSAQERIEERVRLMTKALNLNADQQRRLRTILMYQRTQAQKIGRDPSIAPENRIGALRALNQEIIGRIRAMLDEEQRKKYSPPAPQPSEADATPPQGSPDPAKSPPNSSGTHQ